MKRTIISTILFVTMLALSSLWAQPGPARDEYPPNLAELKLNKDQQQKIKEMQRNLHKELIPLRSQLELKMVDLRAETDKDQPDLAKINVLVDETGKIRSEMTKKRIANRVAMAKVLTPEQLEQWKAQRGNRMGDFWPDQCRPGLRQGMKQNMRHDMRQARRPGLRQGRPLPPLPDEPEEK